MATQPESNENPLVEALTGLRNLPAALGDAVERLGDRRDQASGVDINTIRTMEWEEFRSVVGEAYRRQGYAVSLGPVGVIGGADLVLKSAGSTTYVQCRRWREGRVGLRELRDLQSIMAGDNVQKGIFLTSGIFSNEAEAFASRVGIELVDGHMLEALVQRVRVAPKRRPAA